MSGTLRSYDPNAIEPRRQAAWRARDAFATPPVEGERPRRYVKPSAPFTSGNVHIGHVRSYSLGDAYARFWRARGEDVLFAFGFDAFGLPAELGAIERGESPSAWVARCAQHMRGQLERLGYSFDWERAFMSSDALMYRWSQWLFLTLMRAGLVYRGSGAVDWCDTCQTTLATIQVEPGGLCWRCHEPVRLIHRPQWYLRISPFLQENDERLQELQGGEIWDEVALASQRFVLGRTEGVEVDLGEPAGIRLTAFTSHGDAVGLARFVLISPRHPDVERFIADPAVRAQLEDLRSAGLVREARDAEAIPLIDTRRTLPSPAGGEPLPVLISPVVDGRYGTTAVLGVPARDHTDALIAQRLGLDDAGADPAGDAPAARAGDDPARGSLAGKKGLAGEEGSSKKNDPPRAYVCARASAPFEDDNPPSSPAGDAPATRAGDDHAQPVAGLRPAVRYRASDFSISRQRSWGTPIPIVHCKSCGAVPVPEEQLPVLLPLDLTPTGAGNPLAERAEFVQTSCPGCGGAAERETDTLDCHFDALWLWVPVCVPPEERERPLDEILALDDLRAWLPCERVVAGSDSGNFVFDQRTITKALRDVGPLAFLSDGEPFAGCLFHEMVIRDGRKMSKHLGNVVDPDELVKRYGADTVRLATVYAARPQRTLNWSDSAVLRCHRFLTQVWDFASSRMALAEEGSRPGGAGRVRDGEGSAAASGDGGAPEAEGRGRDSTEHLRARLEKWCAAAIERTTEEMAALEMHLAARDVMRLFERIKDFEKRVVARRGELGAADREALLAALGVLAQLLAPLAPHIAEELWSGLGNESDTQMPWPCVSSAVPA